MEAFIERFLSPDKIYITTALIATVALLFVSILIGITTRRRQRDLMERCRYRPRKQLMTGVDKKCFQLLNELFEQKFYVIPEVSLSSLVSHKVGLQDRHEAFRFIDNKTIDFVLCNKRSLRPICAVKLEYVTHDKTPGNAPDDLKKIFKTAHIPFVYLENPQNLTRARIVDELSQVIYETSKLKPSPRGRHKKTKKPPRRAAPVPTKF